MPGEGPQDLFARVAHLRRQLTRTQSGSIDYISKLVVHAGDAGPVEWRARIAACRSPCFLNGVVRLARWHRRDLERERLARLERRRHRHLLGRGPLDRREGRPERTDVGHHPLHPRDGLADACDFAGLAAPRLGCLLSRHPPPGDRGVPRDPQSRPATSTASR